VLREAVKIQEHLLAQDKVLASLMGKGQALPADQAPGQPQAIPLPAAETGSDRRLAGARVQGRGDQRVGGRRLPARRSTALPGLRSGSRARAVLALPGGATRSWGYLRKSNGLWPRHAGRVRVSAGHRPGTESRQDCRSVRIYTSEQRPQQDSNLRSRLRRALLYTRLTSGNMLAAILSGRISGAVGSAAANDLVSCTWCFARDHFRRASAPGSPGASPITVCCST